MTADRHEQPPRAPATPPGRHRHVWWIPGSFDADILAFGVRWRLDRDGQLWADGYPVTDEDMRFLGFVRCTCTRPGDPHQPGCSAPQPNL